MDTRRSRCGARIRSLTSGLGRLAATVLAVVAWMAAALTGSAEAQTNLVTNGSFAVTGGTTSFQFGTFNGYSPAETLAGWSSTGYNFVFLPTSTVATGTYGNLSLWSPVSSPSSANGFNNAGPTGGNFIGADFGLWHRSDHPDDQRPDDWQDLRGLVCLGRCPAGGHELYLSHDGELAGQPGQFDADNPGDQRRW